VAEEIIGRHGEDFELLLGLSIHGNFLGYLLPAHAAPLLLFIEQEGDTIGGAIV
jgi:hypothetical protein